MWIPIYATFFADILNGPDAEILRLIAQSRMIAEAELKLYESADLFQILMFQAFEHVRK